MTYTNFELKNKKNFLILILIILSSFVFSKNCNAQFTVDATGNTYLNECVTHKQLKNLIRQESEKESKGMMPNYEVLVNLTSCSTAVVTAFRTVTQVGYPWANVNTVCYVQYYGMEDFSAAKLSDLLLKYLKDHPKERNLGISTNMMNMLHNYYPVPKKCFMSKAEKANL